MLLTKETVKGLFKIFKLVYQYVSGQSALYFQGKYSPKLIMKICLKVSVENYFLCDDQTDQKGGSLPLPGAAPAFPQPPERSGSKTGNSRQIRGGVNTVHFTAEYTKLIVVVQIC